MCCCNCDLQVIFKLWRYMTDMKNKLLTFTIQYLTIIVHWELSNRSLRLCKLNLDNSRYHAKTAFNNWIFSCISWNFIEVQTSFCCFNLRYLMPVKYFSNKPTGWILQSADYKRHDNSCNCSTQEFTRFYLSSASTFAAGAEGFAFCCFKTLCTLVCIKRRDANF